ncbi:hypothetical protein, partial [Paraburkholderia caribensis]|uniref:hypothetical protein n=1 Tax=Paraburkholderia caribensis TaxID=75105 RepID=UPI00286BA5E9
MVFLWFFSGMCAFDFALASAIWVCAGICDLALRWHPRFGFALASAMRYLASCVAPVRGGTYFSLPPQRKVGKRKRLTPPALDL